MDGTNFLTGSKFCGGLTTRVVTTSFSSRERRRKHYFSEIPKDFSLPTIDKRDELASFDVDEGFRSIGITRITRPSAD